MRGHVSPPKIQVLNTSTRESLSHWVLKGLSLLVGLGVVAGFVLHATFGLPLTRVVLPVTTLLGIHSAFFVSMYAIRKRHRQSGDLRAGFVVMGLYCLVIGLAGMYFVRQLGIVSVNTLDDLGFSVYVVIVIGCGVAALSLKTFTPPR